MAEQGRDRRRVLRDEAAVLREEPFQARNVPRQALAVLGQHHLEVLGDRGPLLASGRHVGVQGEERVHRVQDLPGLHRIHVQAAVALHREQLLGEVLRSEPGPPPQVLEEAHGCVHLRVPPRGAAPALVRAVHREVQTLGPRAGQEPGDVQVQRLLARNLRPGRHRLFVLGGRGLDRVQSRAPAQHDPIGLARPREGVELPRPIEAPEVLLDGRHRLDGAGDPATQALRHLLGRVQLLLLRALKVAPLTRREPQRDHSVRGSPRKKCCLMCCPPTRFACQAVEQVDQPCCRGLCGELRQQVLVVVHVRHIRRIMRPPGGFQGAPHALQRRLHLPPQMELPRAS
mmetsp:Transcript_8291/g.26369  ORF Transcript_8291/g.26369 Transcript_8291/m.26369 type:complete len:343 (+) Transcript_8291:1896-2924(+)